jgi:hypothetical protein
VDNVLQCECGFEARGDDEEALVAEVQRHAREAHAMTLSHDEALVLAFHAELGANTRPATPRTTTGRPRKEKE